MIVYPQFLHSVADTDWGRLHGSADYVLPRTRIRFGERGYSYCGPATWTTLPSDLHDITDTGTFRKRLKSVLFDRAYHWLLLALMDVSYSGALQISHWWLIDWLIDCCIYLLYGPVYVRPSSQGSVRPTDRADVWLSSTYPTLFKRNSGISKNKVFLLLLTQTLDRTCCQLNSTNCEPSSVELSWKYSTCDGLCWSHLSYTYSYHTEHQPLYIARCARGSSSHGSIRDRWYL